MKKIIFIFTALSLLFISCATKPEAKKEVEQKPVVEEKVVKAEPKDEAPKEPVKPEIKEPEVEKPVKEEPKPESKKEELETAPENEVVAEFDGVSITKKDKEQAKSEIDIVVTELNKVTSRRDYYEWRNYLSAAYIKVYSDKAVLRKVSQGLPGNVKGVQLKNLRDFFTYIFVPSRQQVRCDDISYISPTRVRVIKKVRNKSLIFYNLEKINNKWLLVP